MDPMQEQNEQLKRDFIQMNILISMTNLLSKRRKQYHFESKVEDTKNLDC
jgi:hypothetical protein